MPSTSALRGPRPLRRALRMLLLLALILSALVLALVLPGAGDATPVLALFVTVALVYLVTGVVAWSRRPSNAIGQLLVLGGLSLLLATLGNTTVVGFAVLGAALATSVLAVIVHLLLAFPAGRLSRVDTIIAVSAYAVAIGVPLPALVSGDDVLARITAPAQQMLGATVMLATAWVLILRLAQARPRARRTLIPLYAYGIATVLGVPLASALLGPAADSLPRVTVQLLLLAGIPVAFTLGVLRGGFARTGELVELSERLAVPAAAAYPLATALAHTLGDPSLQVGLRVEEGIVDEDGRPLPLPSADPTRGVVDVHVDARRIGVIVYDARLGTEASHVRTAGQILAIALDRARLSADLRASQRALQASRARIVEATDRERYRIAQDLHDGLQAQLVLLALEAQQIGNAPEATSGTVAASTQLRMRIDAAAGDLRRLVHDVLPMPLTERGLASAVEDLVDRMPIPTGLDVDVAGLDVPVAVGTTAYFVVAEGLANTVKHAAARRAGVTLTACEEHLIVTIADDGRGDADADGRGLRGIADRVEALGGAWLVDSPTGRGTRVEARLPCVS